MEKELLEEKYQILRDFMPGGIVIYKGQDGTILESKGLSGLLGEEDPEKAEEPVNFYRMLCDDDVDRVKEMIETQLEFLHSVYLNIRLEGVDGEVHLCEYRGRILCEENGGRIYMAILKDRNEEEMLQRKLHQKEEMLLYMDELIWHFKRWSGEAAFTYDMAADEFTLVMGGSEHVEPGQDQYEQTYCYTGFWQEQSLKRWLTEESVKNVLEAYHSLGGRNNSGSLMITMCPGTFRLAGKKYTVDYRAVLNDRGSALYMAGRLKPVNE